MKTTNGLNTFRKNGIQSYDEFFKVERTRQSVTQGYATVYFYGLEIVSFEDNIEYINDGERYYGEMVSQWASTLPDEVFIDSVKKRATDDLFILAATQYEVEPMEIVAGFSIERKGGSVYVYHNNQFLMTAPNHDRRADEEYFAVAQSFFVDKINEPATECGELELLVERERPQFDMNNFAIFYGSSGLQVFYKGVHVTTYYVDALNIDSRYITATITTYRPLLERIDAGECAPTGCCSFC